jgi:hypothetical protein
MGLNAGGAAASAGSEYQERVNAWFAAAMLAQLEIEDLFEIEQPFRISSLAFQAATAVDDLVVRGADLTLFCQTKRSLTLSDADGSGFRSAVDQCVRAWRLANQPGAKEWYAVLTSSDASSSVRSVLKGLLLMARLSPDGWNINPLSKEQKRVLGIFKSAVARAFVAAGAAAPSEPELVAFSAKLRLVVMDVEAGGPDERNAWLLLAKWAPQAPTKPLWTRLIVECLRFSAARASCTRDGLQALVAEAKADVEPEADDDAVRVNFGSQPFACGRELLLGQMHLGEGERRMTIFELARFNPDGSRRTRFHDGKCTLQNGIVVDLCARAAAMRGIYRFLDQHPKLLEGKEVVVALRNDETGTDLDATPLALSHAAKVKQLLRSQDCWKCIMCGGPLTHSSIFVEVDEEQREFSAGGIHAECALPTHRILGAVSIPFFQQHPELDGFDVPLWIRRYVTGQGLFKSTARSGTVFARIGWNANYREEKLKYCVRFHMDDGHYEYATQRGRVSRYDKNAAEADAQIMTHRAAEAKAAGNPFCITASGIFGPLARVAAEPHAIVVKADVVPFTNDIARLYDAFENYYAPLCVVRWLPDDEVVALGAQMCLLTEPLTARDAVRNWEPIIGKIAKYRVDILEHDSQVDAFIRDAFRREFGVVVDPRVDLNGEPVAGFPIVQMPD